jgi:hypothetical protein
MAQAKTIVIGCIAAIVLIAAIIACGIGGIFLLGLSKEPERVESEGMKFGKHTNQRGCQEGALLRLHSAIHNYDPIRQSEVEFFIYGCFQTCQATPDFCRGAPTEDGFFTVRQWSQAQCRKEGLGSQESCFDLFKEVSDVCLGKIQETRLANTGDGGCRHWAQERVPLRHLPEVINAF